MMEKSKSPFLTTMCLPSYQVVTYALNQ